MFESHDTTETLNVEILGLPEHEIPEPAEPWALEDFADVLNAVAVRY
jgi:hypothetical protein